MGLRAFRSVHVVLGELGAERVLFEMRVRRAVLAAWQRRALARLAVATIDLTSTKKSGASRGVHPRIGAIDVVPVVPLVPLVALVPLVPEVALVPLLPLLPAVPDEPDEKLVAVTIPSVATRTPLSPLTFKSPLINP